MILMTSTRIHFSKSILSTEGRPEIIINHNAYPISVPESKILKLLIENNNKSIDKNTLIITAWENPDFIGPNSLAVAISNMRKILKNDDIKIINTPKIGYKIIYHEIKKNNETLNMNDKIDVTKKIINPEVENIFKRLIKTSYIQISIFLLLCNFILNVIQSWVVI